MPDVRLDQIDNLRVATPCHMTWDDLSGDSDTQRYCGECRLNVFNFTGMSRDDIAEVLTATEGRVCAQLYQRPDGTVITQDCPVGLAAVRAAIRRRVARMTVACGLIIAGISGLAFGGARSDRNDARLRRFQPFAKISEAVAPAMPPMVMGSICPPPPPPPPAAVMGDIAFGEELCE